MRSFANALTGINEIETARQRQQWERTRWLGMLIAAPYMKTAVNDPREFMPFEWEKESNDTPAKKILTKEEVDAIFQKWEKPNKS